MSSALDDLRALRSRAEGVRSWLQANEKDVPLRASGATVEGLPVLTIIVGGGSGSTIRSLPPVEYIGRAIEVLGPKIRDEALRILAADIERARVKALPAIAEEEKRLAALRQELGA